MTLPSEPANASRDPLSDSGVMRLLGDHRPAIREPANLTGPKVETPTKCCPRCRERLIASAKVCVHCNLYLASPDGPLQTAYRAIRQQLKLPPRQS